MSYWLTRWLIGGYLDHTGVVQEGEQRSTQGRLTGLVVYHGNLDPPGVSSNAETHQRDLDRRQQELEAQEPGPAQRDIKTHTLRSAFLKLTFSSFINHSQSPIWTRKWYLRLKAWLLTYLSHDRMDVKVKIFKICYLATGLPRQLFSVISYTAKQSVLQ